MGERFRVKWTGLYRNLPHAGAGIGKPALLDGKEESALEKQRRRYASGHGAWASQAVSRRGLPHQMHGCSLWVGRGVRRYWRAGTPHLTHHSSWGGSEAITQTALTSCGNWATQPASLDGYFPGISGARNTVFPSVLSPWCRAITFPCTMNGDYISKRALLLCLFYFFPSWQLPLL